MRITLFTLFAMGRPPVPFEERELYQNGDEGFPPILLKLWASEDRFGNPGEYMAVAVGADKMRMVA
jgi:hypothetical protein